MEWQFQAFNLANQLLYAISNDDKNLYLVISCSDEIMQHKILYGGVTFIITDPDNKKDISISYPVSDYKKNFPIVRALSASVKDSKEIFNSNKRQADSLIKMLDKKFESVFKEIAVMGIAQLTEPMISIYNTNNIQAAAKINDNFTLGVEMAIPLKYLNAKTGAVKYSVKLNGRSLPPPNLKAPLAPQSVDGSIDQTTLLWIVHQVLAEFTL